MQSRRFKQVDVFTSQPYYGNPVAVVLDAKGLNPVDMQRIAAWTNLSETTFVFPPTTREADYLLRIFTPKSEIPFAGHPTLGSAHAIMESGMIKPEKDCMVQECGAGLLPIRITKVNGERIIFVKAPEAKITTLETTIVDRIADALGSDLAVDAKPVRVDIGAVWLVALLQDSDAIHTLQPDMTAISNMSHEMNAAGLTVFALTGKQDYQVYTRAFAPAVNVPEDPVCGSGNASVAAFLAHYGKLGITGREYTANQGREVGRNGLIHVIVDEAGRSIEIGGAAVTCVDGEINN
jgi:PhzF family phenazine biosynthesis protein